MNKRVSRTEKQRDNIIGNGSQETGRLHFGKDVPADADSSEQLISKQLAEQFKRFEEAHSIEVPELQSFERFVASSKIKIVKRQKRDLFLFWLAALPLLSIMLWMLGQHTAWYIGLQVVITAGGIAGAAIMAVRSGHIRAERKQTRWNKN